MSSDGIIPSLPDPVRAALEGLNVSRETIDRFAIHLRLLEKWQSAINLVGPATLANAWQRHILDSAQLFPLVPPESRLLVDLGSGGGFPGLVLATMGVANVHLVESDVRKAAFLREVAREANISVTIHALRAEAVTGVTAQTVTARALAPVGSLLPLASRFFTPESICLFPKGRTAEAELTETSQSWTMQVDRIKSMTDPDALILRLSAISRKAGGRRP